MRDFVHGSSSRVFSQEKDDGRRGGNSGEKNQAPGGQKFWPPGPGGWVGFNPSKRFPGGPLVKTFPFKRRGLPGLAQRGITLGRRWPQFEEVGVPPAKMGRNISGGKTRGKNKARRGRGGAPPFVYFKAPGGVREIRKKKNTNAHTCYRGRRALSFVGGGGTPHTRRWGAAAKTYSWREEGGAQTTI